MTLFQIIIILFWGIVYSIMSYISIVDLIKDRFIVKNGSANVLTAIWTTITIFMLIFVSHYALLNLYI